MIIELRKKSQITLPKEIVNELGLKQGNQFDITVEDGVIKLEPVAMYSKNYLKKLEDEIKKLKKESEIESMVIEKVEKIISQNDISEQTGGSL